MIYFVEKRRPVTKWHQFDPGLQTTATIQTEIVSEFENKKTGFHYSRVGVGQYRGAE
jgi:hypothetical protein